MIKGEVADVQQLDKIQFFFRVRLNTDTDLISAGDVKKQFFEAAACWFEGIF